MLIVKIIKAKKKAKQQTDFVGLYLYYRCKCERQNNKGSEENREKKSQYPHNFKLGKTF